VDETDMIGYSDESNVPVIMLPIVL